MFLRLYRIYQTAIYFKNKKVTLVLQARSNLYVIFSLGSRISFFVFVAEIVKKFPADPT